VSRDEAAQVCVGALLDPNALNKSVYMSKKKSSNLEEDISAKFLSLPSDSTWRDTLHNLDLNHRLPVVDRASIPS
jgi:hypothetical protein